MYQELSFPLLPIVPNLVKAYLSFLYTKQSPQLFKKVIWHLRGDTSNMLTSRKVLTYQNYGSAFLCPWRTLLWTVTMPNTSGPCFASQHSGAARNKGLPSHSLLCWEPLVEMLIIAPWAHTIQGSLGCQNVLSTKKSYVYTILWPGTCLST